jgi:hypothetical protein
VRTVMAHLDGKVPASLAVLKNCRANATTTPNDMRNPTTLWHAPVVA